MGCRTHALNTHGYCGHCGMHGVLCPRYAILRFASRSPACDIPWPRGCSFGARTGCLVGGLMVVQCKGTTAPHQHLSELTYDGELPTLASTTLTRLATSSARPLTARATLGRGHELRMTVGAQECIIEMGAHDIELGVDPWWPACCDAARPGSCAMHHTECAGDI